MSEKKYQNTWFQENNEQHKYENHHKLSNFPMVLKHCFLFLRSVSLLFSENNPTEKQVVYAEARFLVPKQVMILLIMKH